MNKILTKIYAATVADFQNEDLYRAAYRKVTEERQKKTDRYRFIKDRWLSLGVELLLMQGLEQAGISRKEVSDHYGYGTNGKPYLTGEPNVQFNLSHSGEMAICAISSYDIGCDVERISDWKPAIAKRFFFPAEYDRIVVQETERARQEMFFRLWTLKESLIKATGQGMRQLMDSFDLSVETDGIAMQQELDHKTYYLQEIPFTKNYKCSVCGLDPELAANRVPLEWLHFSDILADL